MFNCPGCDRNLFDHQFSCVCGWKGAKKAAPSKPRIDAGETRTAISHMFRERFEKVNQYVNAYLKAYPGSTKKDACADYMKRAGLIGALPKNLRDQEAIAERQAIQEESA